VHGLCSNSWPLANHRNVFVTCLYSGNKRARKHERESGLDNSRPAWENKETKTIFNVQPIGQAKKCAAKNGRGREINRIVICREIFCRNLGGKKWGPGGGGGKIRRSEFQSGGGLSLRSEISSGKIVEHAALWIEWGGQFPALRFRQHRGRSPYPSSGPVLARRLIPMGKVSHLVQVLSTNLPHIQFQSANLCQGWSQNFPTGADSSDEGTKVRLVGYYRWKSHQESNFHLPEWASTFLRESYSP